MYILVENFDYNQVHECQISMFCFFFTTDYDVLGLILRLPFSDK